MSGAAGADLRAADQPPEGAPGKGGPRPARAFRIKSLDLEGRGVAHEGGKVIFVEGALTGELVEVQSLRNRRSHEETRVSRVLEPSSSRIEPRCEAYGVCGGCSMQHVDASTQVAAKQRVLEDALWHVGRVRPEHVMAPLRGPQWDYRHRARLSARFVRKKGGALVGFREKRSSYVTDMRTCEVLPDRVAALIVPLRELIDGLEMAERLPQIEVSVGDRVTVLVFRVLESPSDKDLASMCSFADAQGIQIWLQSKGPDTAKPFWPMEAPALDYTLPEFDLQIAFQPTDFTQVNHAMNRMLVQRAITLLDPRPGDEVADFFCGLGNFTLPIARRGARVTGVEGNESLIRRARENAAANGLSDLARFEVGNLFETSTCSRLAVPAKVLLDPPRDGAMELIRTFAGREPRRIVYVACDPGTLARDAGFLTTQLGYTLKAAGIANMFPQTSHVESIALFERDGPPGPALPPA